MHEHGPDAPLSPILPPERRGFRPNGSPKWIEMVIHCHIGARPGLQMAIRRVIAYAKKHEKVWFARRRDIADHMLKTYA